MNRTLRTATLALLTAIAITLPAQAAPVFPPVAPVPLPVLQPLLLPPVAPAYQPALQILQGGTTGLLIAPSASSSGATSAFTLNAAADTAQTASTEKNSVNFNLGRTVTWATGAIATQREVLFQAPTYAFAGASTVTNAATVAINGAPNAGANATLTNAYGLWVQGGGSRFDGAVWVNGTIDTASAGAITLGGTNATGVAESVANTTGSSFALTNNALLTGTGFQFNHTTSVLADGGSLARFSSTSIDTGGATHGTLLDLSSTAAPTATLVELNDSALTTGRGIFATHTSGVLTTGSLVRLTNTTADTGSGQGTLLDMSSTGCATCAVVQLAANALTTGVGMIIPHTTSVIASGGSLMRISSTSVDTGTTTGNLLDLSASGSVAGSLVNIAASNTSQTTETALSITQSGTTTGYTGNFVSLTGSSTTGSGNLLALTAVNTTGGSAETITANSATTSTAGVLAISATGLTSGTGVKITGSAPATMTAAGSFIKVNDGTTDVLRVGQNGVLISAQTSAPTVASVGDGSTGACSGCTDTRGVATDTTAANTNAIIVSFNTTRTPVACTISPGNTNTAADLKAAGAGALTLGAGTLSISAPSGNWGANAKAINYICFY